MQKYVVRLNESLMQLLSLFQAPHSLAIYDISSASLEVRQAVSTLVGLINRSQPEIYLIYNHDDRFWLEQIPDSLPRHSMNASGNDTLGALIQEYRTRIQGIIIYDPSQQDTINLATTIAGLRDGFVATPELAASLQQQYHLPVIDDLRNYQWRSRLHMYRWAQQNFLRDTNNLVLAGLTPEGLTPLRSLLVATRAFVYWLEARKYVPEPQVDWLSERALFKEILATYPAGALHLGWFPDEGSGVQLTSQHALPVYASDYYQNLEVWLSLPMADMPLPVAPVVQISKAPQKKTYLSFTISDGDNIQYCQHRLLQLWRDNARGSLPLGWTISPALPYFAPSLAKYYLESATANDELVAAPSGAGYMFPSRWPAQHMQEFLADTGEMMQAMGLSTLEVLDTDFLHGLGLLPFSITGMGFLSKRLQRTFTSLLTPDGLCGILSGAGTFWACWHLANKVPWYQSLGLAMSVEQAVQLITTTAKIRRQRPLFLNIYVLAWRMSPSTLLEVMARLGDEYELVLPRDLLAMLTQIL
ncbi:GxGYxYP domain-containing protein [Ktedonobacter robiniae]|uniref:GxGYxYP putative glycoside hydrolase N-terminal domain-containing protein n=1 Tax=Ktedonobacter robiniae TaxID=2778365 RepID=A0ABQ3UQW7_9CHLR|nr:GxGYxYP domain-containing protein [Ktedonobacter robiniae]GHO54845.1 hypothetical protein KSB_33200 [Ktedonobacter robiniae]